MEAYESFKTLQIKTEVTIKYENDQFIFETKD
jgi:hypothetical protein